MSTPATVTPIEPHLRYGQEIASAQDLSELCKALGQQLLLLKPSDMNELERHAQCLGSQGKALQDIVEQYDVLKLDNESFSAKQLMELFSHTLGDTMTKILSASKRAIKMVYLLDEAIHSLSTIEQFVTDIQNINKQAKLLAINATIESARAGEIGHGFSIVAEEVKNVSERVQTLAGSMRARIDSINASVGASYDVLKEVATTDIEENLYAKEKLDRMLQLMASQRQHMREAMLNTAMQMQKLSLDMGLSSGLKDPRSHDTLERCLSLLDEIGLALDALRPSETIAGVDPNLLQENISQP